jgi:hypothetical protein
MLAILAAAAPLSDLGSLWSSLSLRDGDHAVRPVADRIRTHRLAEIQIDRGGVPGTPAQRLSAFQAASPNLPRRENENQVNHASTGRII